MVNENVVLQSASEVYHENADQQKKVQYKIKKESNYTHNDQYSNLFEKIVMSRLGYTNTDAIRNL